MKNAFATISVITAALATIAAVLSMLIVVRLVAGTQSDELLATPPKALNLPEMKLEAPALDAQLEPLRDRALFYASRAFYVAPPPPAAPTAPPKPNYLLAGTFVIPHKHTVALLKQGAGTNVVKVKAGDDLEGWHVEGVEVARVVLAYQEERFEIARASRDGGNHVTRAPLKRSSSLGAAPTVGAATPDEPAIPGVHLAEVGSSEAASTATASVYALPAETAKATPAPTVKLLGNGRSSAPIRDAALNGGGPSIEARLYRPPPQ